jgi:hypothetical protein
MLWHLMLALTWMMNQLVVKYWAEHVDNANS